MNRYPLLGKVVWFFRMIGFLLIFGSPIYVIYGVLNWVRTGVTFNQMLPDVVPGLLLYPAIWFIWGALVLGATELVKVLVNVEANTRREIHASIQPQEFTEEKSGYSGPRASTKRPYAPQDAPNGHS